MTSRVLALCVLPALLCSCAATTMTEAECRGADWYKLGDRDGRYYGMQQPERYAKECERFGVRPDLASYMAGWKDAYAEVQAKGGGGGGGGY